MERLREIEFRINEIRAKSSSFAASSTSTSFGKMLDDELMTSRSDLGSSRYASLDAGLAALQPSPEAASWGNGRLPDTLLASIGQGDHRLSRDAAAAFKSMAAAARRDGVVLSVSDSYRSLEQQESIVETHGHYSEGGYAAEPGTSPHGWGLAVDLDVDARTLRWMRNNAAKYGFVEDVAREPWHWTFRQSRSSNGKL